jgi:hypothetical protein
VLSIVVVCSCCCETLIVLVASISFFFFVFGCTSLMSRLILNILLLQRLGACSMFLILIYFLYQKSTIDFFSGIGHPTPPIPNPKFLPFWSQPATSARLDLGLVSSASMWPATSALTLARWTVTALSLFLSGRL